MRGGDRRHHSEVCSTHRWRELDSNVQYRGKIGSSFEAFGSRWVKATSRRCRAGRIRNLRVSEIRGLGALKSPAAFTARSAWVQNWWTGRLVIGRVRQAGGALDESRRRLHCCADDNSRVAPNKRNVGGRSIDGPGSQKRGSACRKDDSWRERSLPLSAAMVHSSARSSERNGELRPWPSMI